MSATSAERQAAWRARQRAAGFVFVKGKPRLRGTEQGGA